MRHPRQATLSFAFYRWPRRLTGNGVRALQALGLEVVEVRPVSLEDLRRVEWAATTEKRQLEAQVRPARRSLAPALKCCTRTAQGSTTILISAHHPLLLCALCCLTLALVLEPCSQSRFLIRGGCKAGCWSDPCQGLLTGRQMALQVVSMAERARDAEERLGQLLSSSQQRAVSAHHQVCARDLHVLSRYPTAQLGAAV